MRYEVLRGDFSRPGVDIPSRCQGKQQPAGLHSASMHSRLKHFKAQVPANHVKRCVRATAVSLPSEVLHFLQQEVTIEGVLHVSALQTRSCMQDLQDLPLLTAPETSSPPQSVLDILQAVAHGGSSNSTPSATTARVALCLATPEDAVPETSPETVGRALSAQPSLRPALSYPMSSPSSQGMLRSPPLTESCQISRCALLSEEVALVEYAGATAWQLTEAQSCIYTKRILQQAAATRRRRRRALVRALRASRHTVNQVYRSIWDDDDDDDDSDDTEHVDGILDLQQF